MLTETALQRTTETALERLAEQDHMLQSTGITQGNSMPNNPRNRFTIFGTFGLPIHTYPHLTTPT